MRKITIGSSVILFVLICCSDVSAPRGRRTEQGTLDRAGIALPVEVKEAERQEVIQWIRGIGSVSADKSVTIGAEVGGRVAGIEVDVGQIVAKGDILARLDDQRLRIARDSAHAEVKIAKAHLENSKREALREADLFEDGVISENLIEKAELQVNLDSGRLEMASAKLAAAEQDLSDVTIVSPIDGEITRKHIEVGELVQSGTSLFDIVNIRNVKVAMQVSEREITRIHKGQTAEIDVDGYPGVTFHGKVHTIGVEADPQIRTYPVEILVVNDRPERLFPGFICRVRIRGQTFQNAIFLPEEVMAIREGRPTVFVITGETASIRNVEFGFRDRGKVLITKGLEHGDRVVVVGQESLRNGLRVLVR